VGSVTEAQETASGGENGGASSDGEVSGGQEVGEARNHSLGGLDSAEEVKEGGHDDDGRNSYVHGAYASQERGHWESSDNSTLGNNPGAAPINPDGQARAKSTKDYAQSNVAQCDVSDGSWVFDESYPLYESNSCPFIDEGFSCQANGRMDQSYMKMRWQPKHCNVPRCCYASTVFAHFIHCLSVRKW
jgi:hypothetical protein